MITTTDLLSMSPKSCGNSPKRPVADALDDLVTSTGYDYFGEQPEDEKYKRAPRNRITSPLRFHGSKTKLSAIPQIISVVVAATMKK